MLRATAIGTFLVSSVCANAQMIHVFFDGKEEDLREPAILRNGRTLLGLRETFDRLGAVVYYDSSTKEITAWRAERTVQIQIGRAQATIDGKTLTMDQPPIIEGRTTYVPLRFLSEALGAEVKYVGSSNSAYIDTVAMNFFNEKAPFKAGDAVLYLYRRSWHPAKVLHVTDHQDSEDSYKIEFKEPSGRVITPTVGRRYLRTAKP
ncbi:MAG: copper amine oxidase N-terminal domain-containing protein [Armatimonadetes bacterium]|nr:copper amine oxidase N-terminal domain-containing protein [Armatimonadota bacterium]